MSGKMKDAKGNSRYLRYVKGWENIPELKSWISPIPGDKQSVFCKVCQRQLYPHKKDLLAHAKTKKHLLNEAKQRAILQIAQPAKESSTPMLPGILMPMSMSSPTIKCEQMEYSFMEGIPKTMEDKSEDRNLTIEIFPASRERKEENDMDGLGQVLTEEISADDAYIHNWKDSPVYKGWLRTEEDKLYCDACEKTLRHRRAEVQKHSKLKNHLYNCLQKGIKVPLQTKNDTTFDMESCARYLPDPLCTQERLVDLRSDTVTQPSSDMREAMMAAKLGDDAYQEDGNIQELQIKVATLLEKEAGLFFPSGRMANLVAVMSHCWSRDSEVFMGDQSKMFEDSESGLNTLCALVTRPLKNQPDGTFSLDQLKEKLQKHDENDWPTTSLICIENTHCNSGGRALPVAWLDQLGCLCEETYLLHLDGARLLNAAICCARTPADLVKHCDSVTFCLDKGLGCPFGSVLVGSAQFIERARRRRDMLGGGMHQSGFFAAAALFSLDNLTPKLSQDHATAREIAQCISNFHSSAVTVDLLSVQSNIVLLETDNIRLNAKSFCERMAMVTEDELEAMGGDKICVLMVPMTIKTVRFMTHFDLSRYDVQGAMKKLRIVLQEYEDILKVTSIRKIVTRKQ